MKKIKEFFLSRISELKAVSWPTRAQSIHSMITVIIIMLIIGILLCVFDFLLNDLVLFFLK